MVRMAWLMLVVACDTGTLTVAGGADTDPVQVDSDDTESADTDTDGPGGGNGGGNGGGGGRVDADQDGVPASRDCNDDEPLIFPDAPERCNLLDDDCDDEIDEGNACPCPTVERLGRPYMLCITPANWQAAVNRCERAGQHLVIVDDANENTFLATRDIPGFGFGLSWWIGLIDAATEDTFLWVDGSPLVFEAWGNRQPDDFLNNEDCVQVSANSGEWNDANCGQFRPFICEP